MNNITKTILASLAIVLFASCAKDEPVATPAKVASETSAPKIKGLIASVKEDRPELIFSKEVTVDDEIGENHITYLVMASTQEELSNTVNMMERSKLEISNASILDETAGQKPSDISKTSEAPADFEGAAIVEIENTIPKGNSYTVRETYASGSYTHNYATTVYFLATILGVYDLSHDYPYYPTSLYFLYTQPNSTSGYVLKDIYSLSYYQWFSEYVGGFGGSYTKLYVVGGIYPHTFSYSTVIY